MVLRLRYSLEPEALGKLSTELAEYANAWSLILPRSVLSWELLKSLEVSFVATKFRTPFSLNVPISFGELRISLVCIVVVVGICRAVVKSEVFFFCIWSCCSKSFPFSHPHVQVVLSSPHSVHRQSIQSKHSAKATRHSWRTVNYCICTTTNTAYRWLETNNESRKWKEKIERKKTKH